MFVKGFNPLTVTNGNICSECAMLLLVVIDISILKTSKIWKHQNRKICHHEQENCMLGMDISVCYRLNSLQRNEQSTFLILLIEKSLMF